VFAENSFDQKTHDIRKLKIDILVMGDDWEGRFDYLRDICQVVYLKRTAGISSTMIRERLAGSGDRLLDKL
jgi:glycerol-3-phosphate cytidylyltransferase